MSSRPFKYFVCIVSLIWSPSVFALPLGTLIHDGPTTPEQISLYLPVTGPLGTSATATVRYRSTSNSAWRIAHPLHRIRPGFSETTIDDAFAGVITGLVPGFNYTVEVTVSYGSQSNVKTLLVKTRALPAPASAPNKTVLPGSITTAIQKLFNGLNPGDVLQFANGTYEIDNLILNRSGTEAQPIYIRGESRDGVILRDTTGRVLYLLDASYVVIEDMTLEGSGSDSGTNSRSEGVRFWDGESQQQVTIRRVTMRGVDKAVVAAGHIDQVLVYDGTFIGNNVWTQPFLESNLTWNDDGVRVPGQGNAVFNNTLSGYGDAFAVNDGIENVGIHFYRNDVLMTGDDAFEGDYGFRNMTFYDNRVHNAMTLISFDPLRGGPAYVFRNIGINIGRAPFKLNNTNTGDLIYNNTVVRTNGYGSGSSWGWAQFDNGPQRAWAYRNNLLIYQGNGGLLAMEASGQDPIDFTNNAWFPNKSVWWTSSGGSFSSMTAARDRLNATTPLFGTSTQRHEGDVISEPDPFVNNINLGDSYLNQITNFFIPTLSEGTAPKASGVAIPTITDGFRGSAPDIGAIITGRALPIWGDRHSVSLDSVPPNLTKPEPNRALMGAGITNQQICVTVHRVAGHHESVIADARVELAVPLR